MINCRKAGIVTAFLTLVLSQAAQAGWTLNNDKSALYYTTSKAAAVTEVNTFHELSGSITDNGEASLKISLASVDTMIDLRNERMQNILFKIPDYLPGTASATVTLNVDARALYALKAGETTSATYDTSLSILDATQNQQAELAVTKLNDGALLIHNVKPLVINAQSFGLAEGVEELRNVAKLPSINNNVVVDFTLRYDRD